MSFVPSGSGLHCPDHFFPFWVMFCQQDINTMQSRLLPLFALRNHVTMIPSSVHVGSYTSKHFVMGASVAFPLNVAVCENSFYFIASNCETNTGEDNYVPCRLHLMSSACFNACTIYLARPSA
jgi:hypothetical protein